MTRVFDEEHGCMIVYMKMPKGVNECVTLNNDGSYTIFISESICELKQRSAYEHALKHIYNDDFYKESVQEIEAVAHGI